MVARRIGRKTVLQMLKQQQQQKAAGSSAIPLCSSFQQSTSTSRRPLMTTTAGGALKPTSVLNYPRWSGKDDHKKSEKQDDQDLDEAEQRDSEADRPASDSSKRPVGKNPATDAQAQASKAESSSAMGSSSSSGSSGNNSNNGNGNGSKPPSAGSTDVAKQSVPEEYPQVLALPIARRPLFPGFYKAVVIRDPAVVAAIKETTKRGQPYLGAFLLKEENSDADIITDMDSVHPVGVFAQITSTFTSGPPGKDGQPGSGDLTVVLYPHRRIRITDLLPPNPKQSRQAIHDIQADAESEGLLPDHSKQSSQQQSTQKAPLTGTPDTPASEFPDADAVTSFETPSDSPKPSEAEEGSEQTASDRQKPLSIQSTFLQDFAVSRVNVDNIPVQPFDRADPVVRAVSQEIISVFKDIAGLNSIFRDQIANFSMSSGSHNVFDEPEKLADFAAAMSSAEATELQEILEATHVADRLQKSLLLLKKELMNAQLQNKISKDVDQKIAKRQREYYLMEQLKGIKKELGMESDGKDKLVEKFMDKVKTLNMPEAVRKVFDEELSKLRTLEPAASEFNVTRNYLDWITSVPWGRHSEENFDLRHARTVLDDDHYGLKDVKKRILEFLAVGKLRGTVEGKILCFVGPPGVGKTSIGKSIARSLNRQFFRFSVGGLVDVAEMKGHRRTYVGAMPGKFIQALKKVETENPLILIDEIDKLGRGINGDPASALLEALDPEQNHGYLDHYLDVPVDLSRVLFVCTANSLDTIPAPLLDRMEVLEVSGYVQEEKRAIASKYLGPQAKEASGLQDANVSITDDAIDSLIRYYCRESGVRRLKQHIEKVYRKAALKIVESLGEETLPEPSRQDLETPSEEPSSPGLDPVEPAVADNASDPAAPQMSGPAPDPPTSAANAAEANKEAREDPEKSGANVGEEGKEDPNKSTTKVRKPMVVPSDVSVTVDKDNLVDYVGPPIHQKERIYTEMTPAGVSTGLGYLGNGSGSCLPVEATVMPGQGGIVLTGKLGEVIKESAQIAVSFIRTHAYALGLVEKETDDILANRSVHLHMPEGSIGKEGPSAGTAILTALVSLFKKEGISSELAMTGEMTLAGQVLAVGGVQEKLLAAQRSGIKTVVVPTACKADIEHNVSDSVKEGVEILYADDVRDPLSTAFKNDSAFVERIKKLPLSSRQERTS